MDFKVIVTISENLVSNPEKLRSIDSLGSCIYRLNGAHCEPDSLTVMIKNLKDVLKDPKIILDLPGNKVRTKGLSEPIYLGKGEIFDLHDYFVNYPKFYSHLESGDFILTNDSNFILEVKEIKNTTVRLVPHSDGFLHNNKGLHARGVYDFLPFIFEKDMDLINIACENDIDYLSLSYVRTAQDIKEIKNILLKNNNRHIQLFAKIETLTAVKNLESILKGVDHICVDRGDLSADIGILNLPAAQDYILNIAKKANKNVYLATQFLKNMEHHPVPLIAEISDLHKTIKLGINGIQLSEETAVGKYPVECAKIVFDMLNQCFPNKDEKLQEENLIPS